MAVLTYTFIHLLGTHTHTNNTIYIYDHHALPRRSRYNGKRIPIIRAPTTCRRRTRKTTKMICVCFIFYCATSLNTKDHTHAHAHTRTSAHTRIRTCITYMYFFQLNTFCFFLWGIYSHHKYRLLLPSGFHVHFTCNSIVPVGRDYPETDNAVFTIYATYDYLEFSFIQFT